MNYKTISCLYRIRKYTDIDQGKALSCLIFDIVSGDIGGNKVRDAASLVFSFFKFYIHFSSILLTQRYQTDSICLISL